MYITQQQLAKRLVQDTPATDTLLVVLHVVQKLISIYGKNTFHPSIQEQIQKVVPAVATCCSILKKTGKTKNADIKSLILLVKQEAKNYTKEFIVQWTEGAVQEIQAFISQKFGEVAIDAKKYSWQGIRITGEWMYYERNIENDTKELLGMGWH